VFLWDLATGGKPLKNATKEEAFLVAKTGGNRRGGNESEFRGKVIQNISGGVWEVPG